ncbi:ABC transporter ATP-binding protein [Dielma fastidiosa]|uniref:ABC transporter ATP-binding protein n=1 Tax=Dielma fastidiosa TaxID=1034346 RepID=UPI0035698B43
MTEKSNDKLLEVKDLKTYFYTEEGVVPSVDGLSFDLHKNETLAIVGESGCGKSVTSLSILRLIANPGKIVTGSIKYNGEDLVKKSEREMMKIRGKDISMIFQEPMTSLNPVFTIGHQIYESLKYHENADKKTGLKKAVELLRKVGIPDAEEVVNEYPHQLSGGMRQRVMIAMALACNPKILIADEPTTALDVTIQAQILNLLKDLKKEMDTAIILITHDLGVVAQIAENVMVMYAGEAVEKADVKSLYGEPLHPYTLGLLKSIPNLKEDKESLYNIPGTVPNPTEYAKGCRFAPRCEKCMERCINESPRPIFKENGHMVRCWLYAGGDHHE